MTSSSSTRIPPAKSSNATASSQPGTLIFIFPSGFVVTRELSSPLRTIASASVSSDVDHDAPPLPLVEAQHAQPAADTLSDEDGDPDVDRVERARLLDREAGRQRQDDLGDDGDVERAARVSRSLQAAGIGERDGDEDAGDAEHPQQLGPDL